MKDEQRTERIMDWLEGRLRPEEILSFEGEMAEDKDFADECEIMEAMIDCLHELDEGIEPSAGFHQRLMASIASEPEVAAREAASLLAAGFDSIQGEEAQTIKVKGVGKQARGKGGKTAEANSFVRRTLSLFRRRPFIPAGALVACGILLFMAMANGNRAYDNYAQAPMATSPSSPSGTASNYDADDMGPLYSMSMRLDEETKNSVVMSDSLATQRYGDEAAANTDRGAGGYVVEAEEDFAGRAGESQYIGQTADAAWPAAPAPEAPAPAAPAPSASAQQSSGSQAVEQKIIRVGNLSLEVEHYDDAAAKIKGITAAFGGFVTNESSYLVDAYRGDQAVQKAGSLTLKVPFGRYDELLEQTGALGRVLNSYTQADDVTAQYIDLRARISVYETKYQRLLELLEISGELETILAIENELALTNADLESLKGQLRYLLDRTDYSTLQIALSEKSAAATTIVTTGFAGFAQRVSESFTLGVNAMLRDMGNFVVWVAWNLSGIALFAVMLLFVWFVLLRRWHKQRKAKREASQAKAADA